MILNFNRLDYTPMLKDQVRAALNTVAGLHPEKNNHLVCDASENLYRCVRRSRSSKVWQVKALTGRR